MNKFKKSEKESTFSSLPYKCRINNNKKYPGPVIYLPTPTKPNRRFWDANPDSVNRHFVCNY